MNYKQLQEFRQQVYDLLNFAQDATFELTDAVLTTRNVYRTHLGSNHSLTA